MATGWFDRLLDQGDPRRTPRRPLRIYGRQEPAFDGSSRLPDFELVD
jgi:hypothetical protein